MSAITSTITLYKDSKIIPSRNFSVDSIEDYLATLSKNTISNYQYLRNDLRLTIKINKSQIYAEADSTYNYNYLKVVQQSITYYYFIIKKTQVSQDTIALELLMDTINTYPYGVAFNASPRTRVIREHKDRLKYNVNARYIFSLILSSLDITNHLTSGVDYTAYIKIEDGDGYKEITCSLRWAHKATPPRVDNLIYSIPSLDDLKWIFSHLSNNVLGFYVDSTYYLEMNEEAPLNLFFSQVQFTRLIDYYSEGINPMLYKEELGELTHKENATWNLIYISDTTDPDSAIDCYCLPNILLNANDVVSESLAYTNFEDGKYYYFSPFNGIDTTQKIIFADNEGVESTCENLGSGLWSIVQVHRTGTSLQYRTLIGKASNIFPNYWTIFYTSASKWKTITSLSFNVEKVYYRVSDTSNDIRLEPITGNFSATASSKPMNILSDVDRVDPKLIKIIEIPYFPANYSYDSSNSTITPDSTFLYAESDYKGFMLNSLSTNFCSEVYSGIENPFRVLFPSTDLITHLEDRNDNLESKMFNSEFYRAKFVYDSFGFIFELEKINEDLINPKLNFNFEFIMTSTINSKFLFRFPEYILKLSTSDYDNILSIARNNEATIYNNSYITYLRTAYRYDLKAIQNKGIERALSYAGKSFTTTTGIIGDALEKNYTGIANKAISYIQSVASMGVSASSEYNSLLAKLESLKNQATSVSGSDDLDLLNAYSNNRAKLCLYKVNERTKNLLLDLFYYFGYTTDEIKTPVVSTRYWFNFLSCDLAITGVNKNINEIAKEELIRRYNEGITFLHVHEISAVKTWDFDQVKENWETSLFE